MGSLCWPVCALPDPDGLLPNKLKKPGRLLPESGAAVLLWLLPALPESPPPSNDPNRPRPPNGDAGAFWLCVLWL